MKLNLPTPSAQPDDPYASELLALIFEIAQAKLRTMPPEEAARHVKDLRRGNAVIALYVNQAVTAIKFNPPSKVLESWFA